MYTIISKEGCVFCEKAKDLLADHFIPFTEFKIEYYEDLRDFVKANGLKTLPQVYQNGDRIGGYTELQQKLGGR